MKIICAGYWKTGTKSLASALRLLGYRVYDYDDQLFMLWELWDKFFAGSVTDDDIRSYLKDVDVLIDGPVIAFWEEISRAIPEAKIVLPIRDEESWWRSFKAMQTSSLSVVTSIIVKSIALCSLLTPTGNRFFRNAFRVAHFCQGVEGPLRLPFLNFNGNSRLYKYQFRLHNSHVLHTVPKEKLLVYKPGSGWDSLCEFLGVEVPAGTPFPHKNKAGSNFIKEAGPTNPKLKRFMAEVMVLVAVFFAVAGYVIYHMVT